jgi:hypothetical protein
MSSPTPEQQAIEAAVRRYLARLVSRYLPVMAGVLALVLVVAFVPSQSTPERQQQSLGGPADVASSAPGALVPGSPAALGPGGSGQGQVQGPTSGSVPQAPGAPRVTTSSSVPGGQASSIAPVLHSGVARSGVTCTATARQVTWSPYAPPCTAAFTGNNGGATSFGVTRSTITLSYRVATSVSDAAIEAATGSAAPPKDADYVKDLQIYIDYFNKQFELYGRKVVLKTYSGKGDYIQEDQGQGGDKAQADAATARGLGAFGDVTFQLRGSNPYWSSLAQQKVVAWGPLGFPDSYYQQKAPYWWSVTPSGSDLASWVGNMTCRRLAGLKAIFSPEADLSVKNRSFGLIHPDNPEYIAIADQIKSILKGCNVSVAREASYTINVAQFQSQATSVMAQMQSAGVTTVLCYCDPVIPVFLGNAAQTQNYRPEWVQPYWGDPQGRQAYNGNWQGMMAPGGSWPAQNKNEAYRVFQLAGGSAPTENYYAAAYGTLLQMFTSLQAAGPNLTPQTMQQGTLSLPDSVGFNGRWTYRTGAHAYTPVNEAPVAWFDPSYTSNFDGAAGAYRDCENQAFFPFEDASAWGGPRKQLHCFNK